MLSDDGLNRYTAAAASFECLRLYGFSTLYRPWRDWDDIFLSSFLCVSESGFDWEEGGIVWPFSWFEYNV